MGYDSHRYVAGRDFVLGGVKIPHEYGLLGHSDADALAHAVIDALLGAARLGDIGRLFPDTDSQFEGISSMTLLEHVREKLRDSGYCAGNIDATVIAQSPRLVPYILQMEENIAAHLGIAPSQVSVKAKTAEGMGFVGRGEGVEVHVVCLIENR